MGETENNVRDAEMGREAELIMKDPQVLFKDFGFYPKYVEQLLKGFKWLLTWSELYILKIGSFVESGFGFNTCNTKEQLAFMMAQVRDTRCENG